MKIITSPEILADAVHELVCQDKNADLSVIREAVEEVEASRVKAVLRATADLEAAQSVKGRRFVIAYWRRDKVRTTHGIVYREEQPKRTMEDDADDGARGHGVLIDDYNAPFYCHHDSMEQFEKRLREDYELPYVIRYLD